MSDNTCVHKHTRSVLHSRTRQCSLLLLLPGHVRVVIALGRDDARQLVFGRVARLDLKLLVHLQLEAACVRREGPDRRVVLPVVRLRGAPD